MEAPFVVNGGVTRAVLLVAASLTSWVVGLVVAQASESDRLILFMLVGLFLLLTVITDQLVRVPLRID